MVVKGDGPADVGSYHLNVRDMDTVPDLRLACAGVAEGSRIQADVNAGQDYTLILKGTGVGELGAYDVKLYDPIGVTGSDLITCSTGDFTETLGEDTYYLTVKGRYADSKGIYQLSLGDSAGGVLGTSIYQPPIWTQDPAVGNRGIKEALEESGVIVLPVMSGSMGNSASQADVIALTTGAVDASSQPIVKNINSDGTGLGADLIDAVAELANSLAVDISVVPLYQPDAGAAGFNVTVTAIANSPGCDPLPAGNVQTGCRPGSQPQFDVSFENPVTAPVAPNNSDAYGGYHFVLQLLGNGQYLLDEVPVYLIPDDTVGPPPPGTVTSTGSYSQDVFALECEVDPRTGEIDPNLNRAPDWSDLYFKADIPSGTSITFSACTADDPADLAGCAYGTLATVESFGQTCVTTGDCTGAMTPSGIRDGFCADNQTCQFIDPPKQAPFCTSDAECENGTLRQHTVLATCDTSVNECVYQTVPIDIAAGLPSGDNFKPYINVQITLNADTQSAVAPTLYEWSLTYVCTNIR